MSWLTDISRADWLERRKAAAAEAWDEYVNTPTEEPPVNIIPFVPAWNLIEGDKRLLLLAAHLETADERHIAVCEPTYDQRELRHPCGTPACAIGHARPLFRGLLSGEWVLEGGTALFAVDQIQWSELFSRHGCGRAETAQDAAAYIRGFVARRHAADPYGYLFAVAGGGSHTPWAAAL